MRIKEGDRNLGNSFFSNEPGNYGDERINNAVKEAMALTDEQLIQRKTGVRGIFRPNGQEVPIACPTCKSKETKKILKDMVFTDEGMIDLAVDCECGTRMFVRYERIEKPFWRSS